MYNLFGSRCRSLKHLGSFLLVRYILEQECKTSQNKDRKHWDVLVQYDGRWRVMTSLYCIVVQYSISLFLRFPYVYSCCCRSLASFDVLVGYVVVFELIIIRTSCLRYEIQRLDQNQRLVCSSPSSPWYLTLLIIFNWVFSWFLHVHFVRRKIFRN